jgi:hypothetical protein
MELAFQALVEFIAEWADDRFEGKFRWVGFALVAFVIFAGLAIAVMIAFALA